MIDDYLVIKKHVSAFIHSKYGPFALSLYTTNQDKKEHIVLSYGNLVGKDNVLTRIHSECFTGDILGSLRCDCGEQLQQSMCKIANEGNGIILYLRQEGRGIGLIEKLKSYNLQDSGKDTIDANLALGYQEDERTYEVAALILKDLNIKSIRLMTNNPKKIESLEQHNINITERVPIKGVISPHNAFYLLTKIKKMHHFACDAELKELLHHCKSNTQDQKTFVTLAYAQSLDGSIAYSSKELLMLSGEDSLLMTHKLRSQHDALLVGIGTIMNDDPLLTVRLCEGKNPQIIILDSKLSIPLHARLLKNEKLPIIFTTSQADIEKKKTLQAMGVKIIAIASRHDRVDLMLVLRELYQLGMKNVMVEGGREVITSFIDENHVDKIIITIAPMFVGGKSVLSKTIEKKPHFPMLTNIIQYKLGKDIIVMGDVIKGR